MKKQVRNAAFAAYGVSLALWLLHAMFPSEAYVAYLDASARRADPRMAFSAERVRPALPLGVRLQGPRIDLADRPGSPLFEAETLHVSRSIPSLFAGRCEYRFDALAYGGRIRGAATLEADDARGPVSGVAHLSGLRFQDHPRMRIAALRSVSGLLGGSITFSGRRDAWPDGEGEARLTISGATLVLAEPVWNLDTIHIDDGFLQFGLKGRVLTLSRAEIHGREVQGTLAGTVQLGGEPEKSRLNLRGTIRPFPTISKALGGLLGEGLARKLGQKSGVSFVIRGTVENPEIRIL